MDNFLDDYELRHATFWEKLIAAYRNSTHERWLVLFLLAFIVVGWFILPAGYLYLVYTGALLILIYVLGVALFAVLDQIFTTPAERMEMWGDFSWRRAWRILRGHKAQP